MNKEEQLKFVENFLDEVKTDIINNKMTIIENMDKVELSQYISDMVASCVFVRG